MAEKEEAAAAAESALDVDRTAADGRGRGRTDDAVAAAGRDGMEFLNL